MLPNFTISYHSGYLVLTKFRQKFQEFSSSLQDSYDDGLLVILYTCQILSHPKVPAAPSAGTTFPCGLTLDIFRSSVKGYRPMGLPLANPFT